jgi:uncharacterized membrane protein YphA (DoxX/SURF4 family)
MNPQAQSTGVSRIPLIGLLLIQLFVGYEWFDSGVTKIVRGGFPGGLAANLHDRVKSAPGWYRSFVDGSIIPNSVGFGYLIEIGELLAGLALIVAALVWLLRWERLPDRGRLTVLATTTVAAAAGTLMAVNFHIANSGTHPWVIPKSGFDESVDLDSLLPVIQLVLIGVSVAAWRSLRATQSLTSQVRTGLGSRHLPVQKGL